MIEAIFGLFGVMLGSFITHWLGHRQSLQLLAAERRIQAHQDAFALWWKLASAYHNTESRVTAVRECQDFWNRNCLYLGTRSRQAFRETLVEVMFYEALREERQKMQQLFDNIENVFRILMADAAVPDVNESMVDLQKMLTWWSKTDKAKERR
jgi:hypothetical protein